MKRALKIIIACVLCIGLLAGGVFAYLKFRKVPPCDPEFIPRPPLGPHLCSPPHPIPSSTPFILARRVTPISSYRERTELIC